MLKEPITITVERPTGPRITQSPPVSLGEMVVHKSTRMASAIKKTAMIAIPSVSLGTILWSVTTHSIMSGIIYMSMVFFTPVTFMPQPAGGGFSGPGDVTSGWLAYWSTYSCFNSAYTGNVMQVFDSATGSTTQTLVTCSTGGVINETINPLSTTCAIACEIATLYDQSGAAACTSSAACNVTATHGSGTRPTLTLNAINTAPCATMATATSVLSSTPLSSTAAQPFSGISISKRTGNTGAFSTVFGQSIGADIRAGYGNGANLAFIYDGASTPTVAATDANFEAFGFVWNNASSVIAVNGSSTTVNLGAAVSLTQNSINFGTNIGNGLTGVACEAGLISGDKSTSLAALSTNAHARYGGW